MREGEGDQEDQARRGAGGRHVREHEDDADDREGARVDRDDGRSAILVQARHHSGQRPIPSHRQGHAARGQNVRGEGREGGENRRHHDHPIADRPREVVSGIGHDRRRALGAHRGDVGALGDADDGDDEEEREVHEQADPEGQKHGAGDRPPRVLHLTADRGDQIEALKRDEGEAHGRDETGGTEREERRGSLGDDPAGGRRECPESQSDEEDEDDDFAHRGQLAAPTGLADHRERVEGGGDDREEVDDGAPVKPRGGLRARG